MKQLQKFFLTGTIILLLGGAVQAVEIEVLAGAGNMAFNGTAKAALVSGGQTYQPVHFPLGHISVAGTYSDLVDFNFRIERDPVLRTRARGTVGIDFDWGRFEMGPIAGLFNTSEQPLTAGIAGSLRLEYPGIIFGSLQGASTLASTLNIPGDYFQSNGEAVLGFWVPHVICSASISITQFTCLMSENLLTRDEHRRYQFSADVYSKNVPYTVRVDMGYQELSRVYRPAGKATGSAVSDELKSIYLGFEGTWQIIPKLRLVLGLEMPLYAWAAAPLKKDASAVFYRAQGGVVLTL